jgi:hypothetical protein
MQHNDWKLDCGATRRARAAEESGHLFGRS